MGVFLCRRKRHLKHEDAEEDCTLRTDPKFSYKNIKNVYTVILFEKSPEAFHVFEDTYFHHFEQNSNTGLKINLLQEYDFIALDIFRKNIYNKGIQDELDAWLVFLSMDDPEMIVGLLEKYPKFWVMYEQIYDICLNTEEVMGMFSRELKELDDNTVEYMIDELQGIADDAIERLRQAKAQAHQEKERADKAEEEKRQLERKYQELLARLEESGKV